MAKTHGRTHTKEYRTWENMKKRCHCKTDPHYPRWGGRGIVVCDRWRHSFEAFLADMGEAPSAKHTIERVNNDGPYSPDNCKWIPASEQAANSRKCRFIAYNGRRQAMSVWAREYGLPVGSLRARLELGWPIHEALTTPSNPSNRRRGRLVTYMGETKSVTSWARQFGHTKSTVFCRLARGMSIHEALMTPPK